MLIDLGSILNVNLGVTIILGYLVLGSLIINGVNSIIENCIELDYSVPEVLTRGLEVANKLVSMEGEK